MIVFRSKKVLLYPNFTIANINIKLRHNVPTSQRSNIEQERGRNLTLGQSTFCRPGGVPIKNCEIALFLHFHVYIWRLLRFLSCFLFAEILPNHATVSELPNLSVSKAYQVLTTNDTNFNQTTVCSHRHHWGIGVLVCTFASLIHARAIPSSSWGSATRWQQAVYSLQWALPQSALQKRRWR